MLNLTELLQSTAEITLRKGEKFLEENSLTNLRKKNKTITSIVHDQEDYSQVVLMGTDGVESYKCSCHQDTRVCSHLAALFLRLERKNLTPYALERKPKAYLSHEKSDLKEMLEKASKEELMSFILSLRSSYRDMPVLIRKNFMGLSHKDFLKDTQDSLNLSYERLRSGVEKDFSTHSSLLLEIHEKAREESRKRNYIGATLLYLLLFEASSRETFSMEAYLFYNHHTKVYTEALVVLSEKKYTGGESFTIFKYLKEISSNLMDLTQCSTLMKIMKNYLTTERDFDIFYDTLLDLISREDLPPIEKNHLLFLEYELLMMVDKEDEAHSLRRENPEVFEFLFMEAKLLIKNGSFPEALHLINQEVSDTKRNWDHKIQWLYLKARILKKLQDHTGLLQVTISLLALGEYKAYISLKKTVDEESFRAMYESIAKDPTVRENVKGVYQRILLEEEDKPRLLDYVKDHKKTITEHFELLHPEFSEQAAALLVAHLTNEAKLLKDQDDFSAFLLLLEKLYIYGHENLASETIMNLVMTYKYKTSLHASLFSLKDAYAQGFSYEDEKF